MHPMQQSRKVAYFDGHLVDVDALLDTKFRDKHIEGGVQHANNFSVTDDRAVSLSQVRDEDTKI